MYRQVIYMWKGQNLNKLVIIGRAGKAHEYSRAAWLRHEKAFSQILLVRDRWEDRLIDQFEWIGHTVYQEK